MTTFIDKIALIRIVDGQILGTRSKGKELYYLPGGKRDPGETDTETLIREIEEELSVHIKPETVAHFGNFEAQADGKAEGIVVKMACYTADYDGEPSPTSEIDELEWLSYKDRDRASRVVQIIFDHLHEKNLLP
ncbi:NUDIX domain-containing protein [Paenibacillus sp. CGMCC 1.16610]|uniref:NUDIX domain-containing protein n=1 Tax=Paenibacillus anseongense TaxID=2682845 RepID=A0ABW9UJ44_9BACL|nr:MULTISPECIES: NUDIX domain-containing protein [Paenibacillus]MBA2941385.1 NUDIX domain-containing protein [Paenibacillus sp. CGMCC 1.16610]MVQ40204.1 NUDIX domain-containing protein [Paenibacillus anseongense]